MRLIRTFLVVCLIFSFQTAHAERKPLVLGIHPYQTPSRLINAFTPLAEYLEKEIGRPIEIHISRDYQTHIDNIGNHKINIAYLGPASYIKLVNTYGKKPILARVEMAGKPYFRGKIVVRQDSKFLSLGDLKNKRFAFGDPNSTMSHLIPRYMLTKAGIEIETMLQYKFLGSHDNVALGVLTGDYDAGAVKENVYYRYQTRGLRELATTPSISEHLFVTCGNIPPLLHEKISNALLNLGNSKSGRYILKSIKNNLTSMSKASDSDYDILRHILNSLSAQGIKW